MFSLYIYVALAGMNFSVIITGSWLTNNFVNVNQANASNDFSNDQVIYTCFKHYLFIFLNC